MPNWEQLTTEIQAAPQPYDTVRQKYLDALQKHTERYAILYYSGWLQHPDVAGSNPQAFAVSDSDQSFFMAAMHGLKDRERGLDLILHTPGGDTAATESLVSYLRAMFGPNIRAIVPQLAMSAGTMIACACETIVMGKHSSIGPIDPQLGGRAAHAILDEFETARRDIASDPNLALLWQPILSKYPPTIVGDCERAVDWSKTMATTWLSTGMFRNSPNPTTQAKNVVRYLADHNKTATHARHISAEAARSHGLIVEELENDDELQDLVLSIHHACTQTMAWGNVFKMVANGAGAVLYSNFQL